MNTQVHLNSTRLSILSIPRDKYWIFVSSIVQLLYFEYVKSSSVSDHEFSNDESDDDDDNTNEYNISTIEAGTSHRGPQSTGSAVDNSSKSRCNSGDKSFDLYDSESSYESSEDEEDKSKEDNYFFHIAFTPNECTIICSEILIDKLFQEPLKLCRQLNYDKVKLIEESFLNLQLDSDGTFDNSSSILELTKPFSERNIPLFFLSSHFSDTVLIPYRIKEEVMDILKKHQFKFSDISNSYILNQDSESFDPLATKMDDSDNDLLDSITSNLEERAFRLFKDANIEPNFNYSIKLLLTGARSGEANESIKKAINIIASNVVPDYFAVTRTSIHEVSLVLPKSSRKRSKLGFNSKNIIGSTQDVIIPISIDLNKLPLDSTGIVAGLAGRIIKGVKGNPSLLKSPFEMNYLSMARSAIIMVPQENIDLVSSILKKAKA